ncbi:hypothetical protein CSV79_11425 [Sporosarcina sp. P13]|uniref:tetratricopeptide repeat protein n=1 Tax=Sporosarcina sp. P13 TaxID=2048263 RepID=UPI000C162C64|nr:hypothetical protein [Sporosarcina sp. P13]PIC63482.1 hypothetical protein CSV79_11425 [Sporosarcina sp. P13]
MNSTIQIEELVKQTQRHIRQKQYLKALATLDSLEAVSGNRQQILWQKALLETKVGRLHIARHYLEEIQGDLRAQAELLEKEIERNWSSYTFLIGEYNAAYAEIRKGDSENALYILNDALHRVADLPISLEVYRMNTLLLAHHRPDLLARFILDLPIHAMEDRVIKRVHSAKTSPSLIEEQELSVKQRKPNMRIVAMCAAIISTLGLSGYLLLSDKEAVDSSPDPPAEVASVVIAEPEDTKLATVEQARPQELADDEKTLFVSSEVAEGHYEDGLKDYRNGNYSRAIKSFEQAVRSLESEYFSDDAAYFLTASYMKEDAYEQALRTVEQFQTEESDDYMESPYREAIRLQESSALLKLNRRVEAIAILEELSKKTEIDWVNHEAASKLKLLKDVE